MAKLRVSKNDQTLEELTLDPGQEYVAGRSESCSIVLEGDQGISREHFLLRFDRGTWNLKVTSRYGEVYQRGKLIVEAPLKHQDVFSLAQYSFEFLEPEVISSLQNGERIGEGAGFPNVSPSAFPGASPNEASSSVGEKTVVGSSPFIPYVKILDPNNKVKAVLRLEGGESWIAGRESSAQIHIQDPRVSRRQFEIRRQGSTFSLVDPGSVNGTFLNGNALQAQKPMPLKSGDSIAVLDNYFCFELHDPSFQQRLDMVQVAPAPISTQSPAIFNSFPAGGDGNFQASPTPHLLGPGLEPGGSGFESYESISAQPSPPPPSTATGKFDYKKHRLKLIIGAVVLVFLAYLFSGDSNPNGGKPKANLYADPFSKLTPEQQAFVKQSLQLAKNYYIERRFESARGELVKLKELIPSYQDSDIIEKHIETAILSQQEAIRNEQLEKERLEREHRIEEKTTECGKLLNPRVTAEAMDECLSEVISFDPNHAKILALKSKVEQILADQAVRETQRKEYLKRVAQLKAIYSQAEKIEKLDGSLHAIKYYQKVIKSNLPDPGGLKIKAQKLIDDVKLDMKQKSIQFLAEADSYQEQKNLKEAVLSLQRAMKVNPLDTSLQERVDKLVAELRKQMVQYYQEGIIEESFGNVFGNDGKSGAMGKWRKIIELDVVEGEYYRKAAMKIRKYGEL